MLLEVCQLKAVHPWFLVEVQQHLWRAREGGRKGGGRGEGKGRERERGREKGKKQEEGCEGGKRGTKWRRWSREDVGSPDIMSIHVTSCHYLFLCICANSHYS